MEQAQSNRFFSLPRVALLLAFFLAAAFADVLFGGKSFFYRDFGVIAYPAVQYAKDCFWRGELPLWNPYSNCGAPFLAQWGTMVLYPGALVYLLLPLPWSLNFFCLLHLWLGGLGMFLLAWHWTRNRPASALAAVGFVFNGVTLAALAWPNYTVALGWMPWVILLVLRTVNQGQGVKAVLASSMQMLAGVPELVLVTWVLLGILVLFELSREKVPALKCLGRLSIVVLLTALICAAQLLPFFDLLQQSHRAGGQLAAKWALPGWGWANFILPAFHVFETPEGTFYQYGQEFLSSTYIGAGVLCLGIVGCSVRQPQARILATASLLAAILALGSAGYLSDWLKPILPVSSLARYPVKFLFVLAFAVPLLAAHGLARLQELPGARPLLTRSLLGLSLVTIFLLWFAKTYPFPFNNWDFTLKNSVLRVFFNGLALLAIYVAITAQAQPRTLAALGAAVALLALDGVTHLPRQNPTIRSTALFPGIWEEAHKTPKPGHGASRAFITPEAERRLLHASTPDPEQTFVGRRLAVWSHLNLLEEVPKVNGSSTLQVREQRVLQDFLYSTDTPPDAVLDFLGVSFQSSTETAIQWDSRTNFLPWVTGGQQPLFLATPAALEALKGAFDPRRDVILEEHVRNSVNAKTRTQPQIREIQVSAHETRFTATSAEPTLVTIPQSFYSCWKAEVGGRETPLWRANVAFQALELPAGQHEIRIVYRDNAFRLGVILSAVGTMGLVALAFAQRNQQFPK